MKARHFAIPAAVLALIAISASLLQLLTDLGQPPAVWPPSRELRSGDPAPAAPARNAANMERKTASQRAVASPTNSEKDIKNIEDPATDLQAGYVQKRIQELQDLAMENDPASLKAIMSELSNPDPEIRKAALDATIQFSSRDAIPGLQEAANRTTDAKEKTAIEDAIEFLKLPSLTEVMQEQGRKPARALPVQSAAGALGATAAKP